MTVTVELNYNEILSSCGVSSFTVDPVKMAPKAENM
jgi:hypothetical protein